MSFAPQNITNLDRIGEPGSQLLGRAREAQRSWAKRPIAERLQLISGFRHGVAEDIDHAVAVADCGGQKNPAEVIASELLPLASACRFLEKRAAFILKPQKLSLGERPFWLTGTDSEIHREPYGVVLIIAPSNYPLFLPGVQVLQALVAGNAIILKPGAQGTSAARFLKEKLQAAGLEADLLQIIPEDAEAARAVLQAGPDKVFFTGSAETGFKVLGQLANYGIPSVMELSGCDAVLIRADADMDLAVRAIVFGLTLNQGKTCIGPRRIYVARSIATEFEGRLAQALSQVQPFTLDHTQALRLRPVLEQMVTAGAHLLSGSVKANGTIQGPLALAGVPDGSALLREDFFAPIVSVITVADDAEAVELASQCPYALGASVFTRDKTAGHYLARILNTGVVTINDLVVPTADPRLPFEGRGRSGFGATRGGAGLLEMTRIKVITNHTGSFYPHLRPSRSTDAVLLGSLLRLLYGNGLRNRVRALFKLLKNPFGDVSRERSTRKGGNL